MPTPLTAELLVDACCASGPSCLSAVTELQPAGGAHTTVAPAKFSGHKGATYAYEQRVSADGQWRTAVVLDSKQSQLNRAEAALQMAINDGHPVLGRMPRLELTYERDGVTETYTDLDLPHRAFDGHFRAGLIDGQNASTHPAYRALRDASLANARALLEASPLSLVYGSWDSSRKARQGRWRSALVGEIIGFCLDDSPRLRGGARVDPVAMQVNVPAGHVPEMVDRQRTELSGKLASKIEGDAKKTKGAEGYSASPLGLGGIPPSLTALAGVPCDRIVRSHVLSFAALRQIRFGSTPDGDAACRALLAALAINGMVRAYAELCLRANCDLVEAGPPTAEIDRRWGESEAIAIPSVDEADAVLAACLALAEQRAGVKWNGQVLHVQGDPAIIKGAVDDAEDGEA